MDRIQQEIQEFYEWTPTLRRCVSDPDPSGIIGSDYGLDVVDSGCPMVTRLRSAHPTERSTERPTHFDDDDEEEGRQWREAPVLYGTIDSSDSTIDADEAGDGDTDPNVIGIESYQHTRQHERSRSWNGSNAAMSSIVTGSKAQQRLALVKDNVDKKHQRHQPQHQYEQNKEGDQRNEIDSPSTDVDTTIDGADIPTGSSTVTAGLPKPVIRATKKTPFLIAVLYGFINATIVIPITLSFASIIYRDNFFAAHTPKLVKLTMFSGMVHQLSFSAMSSIPFAVGQVQDAGLIFLSIMATNMVRHCRHLNRDDPDNKDAILATVTIGLGMATAILGVGLLIIGKLRLAQYVQKLPTCVVGGYLAYIGWFCGQAGLGLMANTSTVSLPILVNKFIFVLPGIVGGVILYTLMRKLRHAAVLPTCIVMLMVLFYAVLFLTGTTVDEATDRGWIRAGSTAGTGPWYQIWDCFRFDLIVWSAYPSQIGTLLSMIFVVALSSSLDIAAIDLSLREQEQKDNQYPQQQQQQQQQDRQVQSLDYDKELFMIGKSNLLSGLLGGYTGSYIFSQTIFSLRAGVRSRITGYTLAALQFLYLVLSVPVLSYVPSFFFGTVLTMICVDLMYSWLWEVRHRFSDCYEYPICLLTFGTIQFAGVEYGILIGFGLYLLSSQVSNACHRQPVLLLQDN